MTQLEVCGATHGAGLNDVYEHSRRTLTIASLAVLATFLDTTILYVAFPDITATFSDTSASELSWVLNAYTIVFAAMLIPAGKLADRVGHRKVFLAGSAIFTVASMACGLAPTAELLIVFRIVQAVGAAALIPSSLALVMHAFTHDQLPRAVAIWGAAGAVAGALGPTLGAAIVEGLGWRWAFFINLPVGIYTMLAGRKSLHESSDPDTRVPSLVGVVLIAARGRSAVLRPGRHRRLRVAQQANHRRSWSPGSSCSPPSSSINDAPPRRHSTSSCSASPTSDGRTWRCWCSAPRSPPCSSARSCSSPTCGDGRCSKPASASPPARSSSGSSHLGPASSPAGSGSDRLLIAGGVLFAGCGVLRLTMLGPDVNYLRDFFPSMVLSGFGVALVFPQLSSVVAQALPPGRAGVGGAVAQAVRQFGGTFGVALTIAFLGAAGAVIDGFDPIWWTIVVGGLATSALVLPMRTSHAHDPLPNVVDVAATATAVESVAHRPRGAAT